MIRYLHKTKTLKFYSTSAFPSSTSFQQSFSSTRISSSSQSSSLAELSTNSSTYLGVNTFSDAINANFKTLGTFQILGRDEHDKDKAICVVVQSPTPSEVIFTPPSSESSTLTSSPISLASLLTPSSTNPLNEADEGKLIEEIHFAQTRERGSEARMNKFVGGRVALRRALNLLILESKEQNDAGSGNGNEVAAILKDEWGAPILPSHITGSITHKDYICVGLAARRDDHTSSSSSSGSSSSSSSSSRRMLSTVGVDLEHTYNKAAPVLQRRILTDNERKRLGTSIPGVTLEEEVLLLFSLKESIFKAIHPFLLRSVDFWEVDITIINAPDSSSIPIAPPTSSASSPSLSVAQSGSAKIDFKLKSKESFEYEARWQRYLDKYWLTCVRVWKY